MYNLTPVSKQFGTRLDLFKEQFQILMGDQKVSYEIGTKYVKIITGPYGKQTLHAFLDFSGNIYKPRNERSPNSKILGSIYDDNFGIPNAIGINGVPYVR